MAEYKGLDPIQKALLSEVADLHKMPEGAYSLRINGKLEGNKVYLHDIPAYGFAGFNLTK